MSLQRISSILSSNSHTIVLGNGLIGSESVNKLISLGQNVTWAARNPCREIMNSPRLRTVPVSDFFHQRAFTALFQGLEGKKVTLINTLGVPHEDKINTLAPLLVKALGEHQQTTGARCRLMNMSTMMVYWSNESERFCPFARQMKEAEEESLSISTQKGVSVTHLRLDQVIETPIIYRTEKGEVVIHIPSKHPFSIHQLASFPGSYGLTFDIGRAPGGLSAPKTKPICLDDVSAAIVKYALENIATTQSQIIHAVGPEEYSASELTRIISHFINGEKSAAVEIPIPLELMKAALRVTGDMGRFSNHAVKVLKMVHNTPSNPSSKEMEEFVGRPLTKIEEIYDPAKSRGAKIMVSMPPISILAKQMLSQFNKDPLGLANLVVRGQLMLPGYCVIREF